VLRCRAAPVEFLSPLQVEGEDSHRGLFLGPYVFSREEAAGKLLNTGALVQVIRRMVDSSGAAVFNKPQGLLLSFRKTV